MPLAIQSGSRLFGWTPPSAPTEINTSFPATEDPISEGGIWLNGGTGGSMPFGDVVTVSGYAMADRYITPDLYDDSLAIIDPTYITFSPNQWAEATLYKDAGYTPPSTHEVEILLRGSVDTDGPNYFPLYEMLIPWASGSEWNGQIVRQAGNMGGFTVLTIGGPGFVAAQETGGIFRAEITGSDISVYYKPVGGSFTLAMTCTDATIATGQPGIGFFVRPGSGADVTKFCWSDFRCGNL